MDTGTIIPGLLSTLSGNVATIDASVDAILVVSVWLDTTLEADGAPGFQFSVLTLENAPGCGDGFVANAELCDLLGR